MCKSSSSVSCWYRSIILCLTAHYATDSHWILKCSNQALALRTRCRAALTPEFPVQEIVVLTTKKDTPPAPKNSTGKLQNMNKAATPRFFSPGVNAWSRAVVNIRPRTDSAAKDNKSNPMRNPIERSKVGCSPCCQSGDGRLSCTRRLCGICQMSLPGDYTHTHNSDAPQP